MKYLVTGATGGFALNKLKELVPVSDIHILARSEEKVKPLAKEGYTVHIGDFLNYESLKKAFNNIDRLLFVSSAPGTRQEEHSNVVRAAKDAGVKYIVYTSFPKVENSKSMLAADHLFTENAIKESGIAHSFLRNNWYLENEMPIVGGALQNGKFLYAAGLGKVGWALKREYAEAAAIVLAGNEMYPEVLELTGEPIDYATLAKALKEATNKEFDIVSGSDKDFVHNLVENKMPEHIAEILLTFQHDIKEGVLEVLSSKSSNVISFATLVKCFIESS